MTAERCASDEILLRGPINSRAAGVTRSVCGFASSRLSGGAGDQSSTSQPAPTATGSSSNHASTPSRLSSSAAPTSSRPHATAPLDSAPAGRSSHQANGFQSQLSQPGAGTTSSDSVSVSRSKDARSSSRVCCSGLYVHINRHCNCAPIC